jgi:hypothetical protein
MRPGPCRRVEAEDTGGGGTIDRLKRLGAFVYEFLVGDDWRLAVGAVVAVAAVGFLVEIGLNAWWAVPSAVPATLWWSLRSCRGAYRNRTGVNGFAGRCVTTPPRRRDGKRSGG